MAISNNYNSQSTQGTSAPVGAAPQAFGGSIGQRLAQVAQGGRSPVAGASPLATLGNNPFLNAQGLSAPSALGGFGGGDRIKDVAKDLTSELKKLTDFIKSTNRQLQQGRQGGFGGAGGGMMPSGITQDANGRFRDAQGRFTSNPMGMAGQGGFTRILGPGMGGMMFNQGGGVASALGGANWMGAPYGGANIAPRPAQGLPTPYMNFSLPGGGVYGAQNPNAQLGALAQGSDPRFAHAANYSMYNRPASAGPTYGQSKVPAARDFAQSFGEGLVQYDMSQIGGGSRFGNMARGFLNRATGGRFGRPIGLTQVQTVNEIMSGTGLAHPMWQNNQPIKDPVYGATSMGQQMAQDLRNAQIAQNARVLADYEQGSRSAGSIGSGLRESVRFARDVAGAASGMTGNGFSQIAAGVPFVGPGLSTAFSSIEEFDDFSTYELPTGQARYLRGANRGGNTAAVMQEIPRMYQALGMSPEQSVQFELNRGLSRGRRSPVLSSLQSRGAIAMGFSGADLGAMESFGFSGTGFRFAGGQRSQAGLAAQGIGMGFGITGPQAGQRVMSAYRGAGMGLLGMGGTNIGFNQFNRSVQQLGFASPEEGALVAQQGFAGGISASRGVAGMFTGGPQLFDLTLVSSVMNQQGVGFMEALAQVESMSGQQQVSTLEKAGMGADQRRFIMSGKYSQGQISAFEKRGRGGRNIPGLAATAKKEFAAARQGVEETTSFSARISGVKVEDLSDIYGMGGKDRQDKFLVLMEEQRRYTKELADSLTKEDIQRMVALLSTTAKAVTTVSSEVVALVARLPDLIDALKNPGQTIRDILSPF